MTDYRAELSEYLRNRMAAVAPNLTVMVGELVGARLIAHAGAGQLRRSTAVLLASLTGAPPTPAELLCLCFWVCRL